MSDNTIERILATLDAEDRALLIPFGEFIRDQEAEGLTLSHEERMQFLLEFSLAEGVPAVSKAILKGHELLRNKMH